MRVELTPAVLNDGLEISWVEDNVGAAIGSVGAADIATKGAETRVLWTLARA